MRLPAFACVLFTASMLVLPACSQPLPASQPTAPAVPLPAARTTATDTDRYLALIRPFGPASIASLVYSPDNEFVAVEARYSDSWTNLCGACRVPAGDIY